MLKEDEIVVGILFDNGSGSLNITMSHDKYRLLKEDFQAYHEDPELVSNVYFIDNHAIRLDSVIALAITNIPIILTEDKAKEEGEI